MAQIAELLELWQDHARASQDVKKIALGHAADLGRRIAEMDEMRQALHRVAFACHGDERPDCPILGELSDVEPSGSGHQAALHPRRRFRRQ